MKRERKRERKERNVKTLKWHSRKNLVTEFLKHNSDGDIEKGAIEIEEREREREKDREKATNDK